MSWTSRNLNNIEYLNYLIKNIDAAEEAIAKHNFSPFIMQPIIYDFEEYLEYKGIYINQRRIAKRYLRKAVQILKKYLPPGMVLKTKYISYLL